MCSNPSYLTTPSGILKIIEILCVIIAFGIFRGARYGMFGNEDANYFACGILVAAFLFTPVLLFCYLMGRMEIQRTMLEPILNFLFFALLVAAGVLGVYTWSPYYDKRYTPSGFFPNKNAHNDPKFFFNKDPSFFYNPNDPKFYNRQDPNFFFDSGRFGYGETYNLVMAIFTITAGFAYLADTVFVCIAQRNGGPGGVPPMMMGRPMAENTYRWDQPGQGGPGGMAGPGGQGGPGQCGTNRGRGMRMNQMGPNRWDPKPKGWGWF